MVKQPVVDVILGGSYGDEGKGKICNALLENSEYTHCLRYCGGGNAGHTIYYKGKKFITHLVPSGIFQGKVSVIGCGCVVNVPKLLSEIEELEQAGIPNVSSLVRIAKNAHIVTKEHLLEDGKDTTIGTTKTGNGPAFRDKYNRTGTRAEKIPELKPYLVDLNEEFYKNKNNITILAEGAQGYGLDIDWGDYPYVTSSHCGVGGVLLNGLPPSSIRNVFGCIKAYDTYVGAKSFEDKTNPIFPKIRELGKEYGATTGRPRQCNWLDFDLTLKMVAMNGVTKLFINKIDILREIQEWHLFHEKKLQTFDTEELFKEFIINKLPKVEVVFSDSPERI